MKIDMAAVEKKELELVALHRKNTESLKAKLSLLNDELVKERDSVLKDKQSRIEAEMLAAAKKEITEKDSIVRDLKSGHSDDLSKQASKAESLKKSLGEAESSKEN